jgi:hypothetical protein
LIFFPTIRGTKNERLKNQFTINLTSQKQSKNVNPRWGLGFRVYPNPKQNKKRK